MSKIKIKNFAFGMEGLIPSTCTIVTGVEWGNTPETHWWKKNSTLDTKYLTKGEFANRILQDVKSDTVMFGGSDWSEQLGDLDRCIKIAIENGKKVALLIPCDFEIFQLKLGVWLAKNDGSLYQEMIALMDDREVSDNEFFKMLGMAYLDNQLQHDYYVIAGYGKPKHYFIRVEDGDIIE